MPIIDRGGKHTGSGENSRTSIQRCERIHGRELTTDDGSDRGTESDGRAGRTHVPSVATGEVHQHRNRKRERADGKRAPDSSYQQHTAESDPHSRRERDDDVTHSTAKRTEHHERSATAEGVAHDAPHDRENDERGELCGEKPRTGEDTTPTQCRNRLRKPGIEKDLCDQDAPDDDCESG